MQLVAYGAQDVYLTGNPQITFFKTTYRRHTNYSMECIKQYFNGTVGAGQRVVATISRNGDLVHDCFLKVKSFGAGGCGNNPGHNMIDNIEVEIGGQLIDRHYGHWMEAHAELTEHPGGPATTQHLVYGTTPSGTAHLSSFQLTAAAGGVTGAAHTAPTIFVPLRFWFCRHVGLALPLIALQYHEVNMIINFTSGTGTIALMSACESDISLWCNYIYLDTDERRRFAQVSHEYLIEQVQIQSFNNTGESTLDLNFNHPVKELVWVGLNLEWGDDGSTAGEFTPHFNGVSATAQLKLNGHDRFEQQEATYFTRYQIHKYHTGKPYSGSLDSISVYSFALKPEEHQPSGTCNFSRIDNAQLKININTGVSHVLYVYAVNYNVLRIMSGMGGLAYSN